MKESSCWVILKYFISYYPEPGSHIRDKFKVVLDLSNYATKQELEHPTSVDTSD